LTRQVDVPVTVKVNPEHYVEKTAAKVGRKGSVTAVRIQDDNKAVSVTITKFRLDRVYDWRVRRP
jgi:hypothetical protein